MLGTLTETQMNNLLTMLAVGRIGYSDGGKSYITPVTYAFDGKYIYGQTNEGLKLDVMRRNPFVCFEVDSMLNMANWESVIVWGYFEELEDKEAMKAREYLYNSILDLLTSSTVHLHEHSSTLDPKETNRIKRIMYRIRITEKTGRYEKQ
jgi:nitroimidazol reductase NimA-like FMN-containing flavoprotein (pyridoxamine 5'-phosphate oxidase superfamily)